MIPSIINLAGIAAVFVEDEGRSVHVDYRTDPAAPRRAYPGYNRYSYLGSPAACCNKTCSEPVRRVASYNIAPGWNSIIYSCRNHSYAGWVRELLAHGELDELARIECYKAALELGLVAKGSSLPPMRNVS